MATGKRWRILAQGDGGVVDLQSPEYAAAYRKSCKKHGMAVSEHPVAPASAVFDELVIDDWLHLEQMDTNSWWMRVGDACVNVTVRKGGKVVDVSVERGVYGPVVDSSGE